MKSPSEEHNESIYRVPGCPHFYSREIRLAGIFVSIIIVSMHALPKNYLRFGNRDFGGGSKLLDA